MSCVVFLDRHHAGKPHSIRDRGAWGDLNANGHVEAEELEAMGTGRYLWFAELRLIELGHAVLPISDGAYSDRHQRVNGYAYQSEATKHVYVAAHLNAGGGRYGACLYDHRSTAGPKLAAAVAKRLERVAGIDRVDRIPCGPDGHVNAWATIRGVLAGRPVGLCYEPAFIDQPLHRNLVLDGRDIGWALAEGIDDFVRAA